MPWGGKPDPHAPSFPKPTLLNTPVPVPSPALCLSHLPQYFHLVPPPQRQLVWGLGMVVKQDPVGLRVGD